MRTAFYAGASGLLANQKAMDNIANNVANVSTAGYKPQNISFQSLIFDEMYVNTPTDPEKGNGVKSEINDTNFNPSSVTPTSYDLDFAIVSNALFAVEQDGLVAFTRAGNFSIGMAGDTGYLVTANGEFVLDSMGNRITLQKEPGTNNFDTSNIKYVEELFDVFASDFDVVLKDLDYDSPNIIAQHLKEYFYKKTYKKLSILDLGCGSGLCGKQLKKIFKKSSLYGVDISSQMLKKAKEKNVYDKLVKGNITDCFCSNNSLFDVVVASDVFTYFGELDSIFKKVDSLLCKNGVFSFTISENFDNKNDYYLMPSSRFVHSINYVKNVLNKYGFSIVKNECKILRKEGGNDIKGRVILAQKQ